MCYAYNVGENFPKQFDGLSDEELAEVVADIPADRIGKPTEVASVVLSLAEATNYLTGQIIKVDGGWI